MPLDIEAIRKKQFSQPVSNVSTSSPRKNNIRGELWFERIRENFDLKNDVILFYKNIIKDAIVYIELRGNIEELLLETPGLAYWYNQIMVDAQMIEKLFDDRKQSLIKKKYHEYAANPEFSNMKTTELQKLAASDDEVLETEEYSRIFEFYKKQLDNICTFFDNRKYTLNHIVEVRKHNLQEVWVDSTKETHI